MLVIVLQSMLGHAQNRQTSTGHVKQTTADNMYAFVKLRQSYNCTQVCGHSRVTRSRVTLKVLVCIVSLDI
jgi:hypothetical protein